MKSVLYTRTAATALRKHANRAKLIRAKIRQYADDASAQANNVNRWSASMRSAYGLVTFG